MKGFHAGYQGINDVIVTRHSVLSESKIFVGHCSSYCILSLELPCMLLSQGHTYSNKAILYNSATPWAEPIQPITLPLCQKTRTLSSQMQWVQAAASLEGVAYTLFELPRGPSR